MNSFLKAIKNRIMVFDGSKGTLLHDMGLSSEECPESWNLTHSEEVKKIYNSYIKAGSDVIQTNTFGANRAILEKFGLSDKVAEINTASVKLAKEAAGENTYVAASIGPTGRLFKPFGDLSFEDAYEIFKEQIIAVTKAGADIINFETFSDLTEMRAAIIAARENSPLPIIASMTFEKNGFTLMGNSPAICALVCQSLGADVVGANCSSGPEGLLKITNQMNSFINLPLSAKANAGLPVCSGDKTTYNETPENFKNLTYEFIKNGVKLLGGCCGTTPEHIEAIKNEIAHLHSGNCSKVPTTSGSWICSTTKYLNLNTVQKLNFASLINPENLDLFKNKLDENSLDMIIDRAMEINSGGFDSLYINLDVIGKSELLEKVTETLQTYCKLPLIFESNIPGALEIALRIYSGKAGVIINSISDVTFDLILAAKKYGSTIIEKL